MRDAYEGTVEHAAANGYTDEEVETLCGVLVDAAHGEAIAADAAMHAARHMGRMRLAVEEVVISAVWIQIKAAQGEPVTPDDMKGIKGHLAGALDHAGCGASHHQQLADEMGWTNR